MAAGIIYGHGPFFKLSADMKWVDVLNALLTQMQNKADVGRTIDSNGQKSDKCVVCLGWAVGVAPRRPEADLGSVLRLARSLITQTFSRLARVSVPPSLVRWFGP